MLLQQIKRHGHDFDQICPKLTMQLVHFKLKFIEHFEIFETFETIMNLVHLLTLSYYLVVNFLIHFKENVLKMVSLMYMTVYVSDYPLKPLHST